MRKIMITKLGDKVGCNFTPYESVEEAQADATGSGSGERVLAVVPLPDDEGGVFIDAIGGIDEQPREALEMLFTDLVRTAMTLDR